MLELRPMKNEDLDEAAGLDALIFPHSPWGKESFRGNIENSYDFPVAAFFDGKLCGYGILRQIDAGEILLIGVHPAFRRRGIGRQIMQYLLEHSNRGENIFLEVRDSNEAAGALYRSLGFSEIARRRGYYQDPTEDAVIMML